jgi:polyhydroxyalkanoate synthesis regulator phasin
MAEDREALYAALNEATDARARADQRFRAVSRDEIGGAEDPIALQDMERNLEALRHDIAALDVEIAELERKIAALGGSVG